MLAHGVLSNAYGIATLHCPVPHELAAELQSDGVVHGGRAGINLLTCTTVNSFACGTDIKKRANTTIMQEVRVNADGYIAALDFVALLTRNDRKRASQALARLMARPETQQFFALRDSGNKHPRKLIGYSEAIQLLLVLPKRTASVETRRAVAKQLADMFGGGPIEEGQLALRRAQIELRERELELERAQKILPLDRIGRCIELLEKCGPLSEHDSERFRQALLGEMT